MSVPHRSATNGAVTELLQRARSGDAAAVDALVVAVYDELRGLALRYLGAERREHTLQPTALVHEAYVRLASGSPGAWEDRAHFLAAAATAMRRILVMHARSRLRQKRGNGWQRVALDVDALPAAVTDDRLVAVDEALDRLAERDPQRAKLVELRFFAGQTVDTIAAALGRSPRSVARDWKLAKAWLSRELCRRGAGDLDAAEDGSSA